MSTGRVRKVADRIQVIVAEMLERRIKDARLGFVTITDVRVTGDTQHASIFYTVLGDDEQRTASGAALESAKGLIRSEVGKQLGHAAHADARVHPRRAARDRGAHRGAAGQGARRATPRSPRRPRRRRTPARPTRTSTRRADDDDADDETRP